MSARSKKSKNPTQRRRKLSLKGVTPVAIRSRSKSGQAMIPVAIQSTGDGPQAEAIIPVEVKTAAGKSVKRAAVVPVTVKEGKKSRRPAAHRRATDAQRREPQDTLTRGMVMAIEAEESVANAAGQMSLNMLEALPRIVRSVLRAPTRFARKLSYEMGILYDDAHAAVDHLAA